MKLSNHAELIPVQMRDERARVLSPVLLHDENNLILVDTGFPRMYELFDEAIAKAGFEAANLTGLIFTHQDIDHIGSAREFAAKIPGLRTYAHEIEAPYIDGSKPQAKIAAKEAAGGLSEADKADFAERKKNHAALTLPVDELLKDGQVLDSCGGIEIIHIPGHTPGHICLLLKDGGFLLAGDALNLDGDTLLGPSEIHTMDLPLAKNSLKKLLDKPIKAIVCYHGGLFTGDINKALGAIIEG